MGWRSTYATVVVIGVLTLVAIELFVPRVMVHDGASPRQEMSALKLPQVWLTLPVGAVGFGGFFAIYSYVAPTLTEVSGFTEAGVPVALALFGVGMTLGTMLGGRFADWSVRKTLVLAPVATLVVQLAFTLTAHAVVPAAVTLLVVAFTSSASSGAHRAAARRVRRRQGARRDSQPLGAQRRQRSRCLARGPGDRRGPRLHRAGRCRCWLSVAGLGCWPSRSALERRGRPRVAPAEPSARRPDWCASGSEAHLAELLSSCHTRMWQLDRSQATRPPRRRDRLSNHGPCGVARCSSTIGCQPAMVSAARSGSSRQ